MGPQQTAATPQMHGGESDAISAGDVVWRQESGSQQSRSAVLEPVGDAQAYHAVSGEGTLGGRADAALVEQVGDFGFGVGVEEFIDLTDDGGVGRPEFDAGLGQRDLERACGPTREADVGVHALALGQRHVGNQEAHHPFLLAGRGRGVSPEPRKVAGEGEDLGALFVADHPCVDLVRLLIRLLCRGERAKAVIPFRLERVGHESIVGIDLQEATLRQFGVVAGAFDLLLSQSVGLFGPRRQFLLHAERDLQRERRHRLDENVADRVIERAAVNRLADAGESRVDPRAATPVVWHGSGVVAVVADRHPFAAAAADREALQERRPFARRASAAIGATRLGIRLETAQVLFVVLPGDVARMGPGQEDPLVARRPRHVRLAVGPDAVFECVRRRRRRRSGDCG